MNESAFFDRELKMHLVRYYMRQCENHGMIYKDWVVVPQMVFTFVLSGHDSAGIYLNCQSWQPTIFQREEMEEEASAVNAIYE